jgi:hypothetical protein
MAEGVRSLLPRLESFGITTAAAADITTRCHRLRQEAHEKRGVVISSSLVDTFAG